jgi:DNA-binding MarR family transcriptional regulator
MKSQDKPGTAALARSMVSFVRAFGLHRPEETPCGEAIPVAEAHALMDLASGPLSHGQLAIRLHLEKSTVTRLVRQLQKRGWVQRYGTERDSRVKFIRLTAKGRAAWRRLEGARHAKFERLMAAIPAKQRSNVIEMLELLREAMGQGGSLRVD